MSTVKRIAKFGAVGAVALIVDVAVFNLLCHVGDNPPLQGNPFLGKAISTLIAIFLTWLGNRLWTFRGRGRSERTREFAIYLLLSLVGLGISLVCLWVSRSLLGLASQWADNVAANIVGLAAGSIFKYWSYQTYVFSARDQRRGSGEDVIPQIADRPKSDSVRTASASGPRTKVIRVRRPAVVGDATDSTVS